MATPSVTRRPARAPTTLDEKYDNLSTVRRELRAAGALLRSTLPLTFDGLPDKTDERDFAAVARSAQTHVETAESGLSAIAADCQKDLPAVWRDCCAITEDLFHVFDGIACAIFTLESDAKVDVEKRMTESAPGGALALAASMVALCEERVGATMRKVERQIGGGK